MVPEKPIHTAAKNIGIGDEFYKVLRQGLVRAKRAQNISFVGDDTLQLDSEQLRADVVIFATGWRQNLGFLDEELRRQIEADCQFKLYRRILPPRERYLGFIGYASSANCPLTSELAAHWLSQCFRGELALPSTAEMEQETTRVRHWTTEVLPKRPEGYFIGAYVAHYADELLRDMNLRSHRNDRLLSEYLAPLWAERYRGVTEERRLARVGK